MSIQELIASGGGVLLVVMSLVEIAPVKVSPWSWVAKKIGQAVNADLAAKVDSLGSKVEAMENGLASMQAGVDEQNAICCRVRILRFGDEVLHGVFHSKDHFDQVLSDITTYENYKKVKTKKDQARASAGESIERRPPEVMNRKEFGHWEMDTVYSKKNSTSRALLVLTERKTRKEIIIAIPNRKAETIVKAIDALERKLGAVAFRKIFKSVTVDNGSEFAAAEELERSAINKTIPRTAVYFCHPYSSWERGSNENANIMIRRKHPKGTDFAKVSAAEIKATETWINNYPRKILGYKSSEIMFRECLRELGIAA